MRPETRQSMEMLFAAKWNLPTAAKNAGLLVVMNDCILSRHIEMDRDLQ